MQIEKYSSNELKEFHGEHVDLYSGKHNITTHHMSDDVSLNVQDHSIIESKKKNKKNLTPYNYNDLWKVLLIELIANVTFMLIENYAKGDVHIYIFGVFMNLMTLYPVSGCNTNGYISWALWYYEEEFTLIHTIRRYSYIFLIQPLGMLIGQVISIGVIGPDVVYLKPKDTDPIKIAFCEFFFTGALIFIAIHTIVSKYNRATPYVGTNFIIFVAFLYYIILAGKEISGSSYNPTKYLVCQGIAYHRGIEPDAFRNWYCYIFPQLIGNVSFTMAYKYFFEPLHLRLLSLKYKWEDKFYPQLYE